MRKLLVLLLVLALLLLSPLLAMRSEKTLLALATWGVDRFTDLRLVLRNPVLRPLEGIVSAREIHLYPKGSDGPPLLTVLDLSGRISVGDLYAANLRHSSLRARELTVYVSDRDETSDPQPRQWLRYARWLPQALDIEQVHVVNASDEVFIFPLQKVVGRLTDRDHYNLRAQAQYAGEPLGLELGLSAVRSATRFVGLDLSATAKAPVSGSEVRVEGELRGGREDFNYSFTLDADYTELASFMRGFRAQPRLRGALQVHALMQGDTDGFTLSDASFRLDNSPEYQLNASGRLEYRFADSSSSLQLEADGELDSMETLLDWVDIDLSPLGRASGSASITGSLAHPVVENLQLSSQSDSGLTVHVSGKIDPNIQKATENRIQLDIAGPELSVLSHWTGKLPFEPGPFKAQGTLISTGDKTSLQDIVANLGREDDVRLKLTGSIAGFDPAKKAGLARVEGADLKLWLAAPDSILLRQYWDKPIPGGFKLDGHIDLKGTGEDLPISGGEFTASAEGIRLTAVPTGGALRPLQQPLLDKLRSSLALEADSTADFSVLAGQDIPPLGKLSGTAKLVQDGTVFRLDDVALALAGSGVSATATGALPDFADPAKTTLEARFRMLDADQLEAATGLRIQPGEGSLSLATSANSSQLSARLRAGQTRFTASGDLSYAKGSLNGLRLAISSPDIRLRDIGLQAEAEAGSTYRPAANLEKVDFSKRLEKLLQKAPAYPTDVTIDVDHIVGKNTNIKGLHLQLTGESRRYTLRRMSVGYGNTEAEVRGIIDLNTSPPYASLAGEALALPLSTLSRDLGIDFYITGEANINGGFTARGTTGKELLANLNGSMAVALEDSVIEGAAYDVLATDLLAWFYSGAALEKSTRIDCTMASFKLADGVAKADDVYIETSKMVATGKAKLDFGKEQMDVEITPRSKLRDLQVPSSVKLKGEFKKPRVIVSPIAAAFDATFEFISLVPQMARKIFGVKRDSGEHRPCSAG